MIRFFVALAVALGLASAAAAEPQSPDSPIIVARHGEPQRLKSEPVTIATAKGQARFTMQIAADDTTREIGLMFVKKMGDHEGMIFDFPQAGEQAFWMHGTYIALDILYVSPDGRVLSIAKNAKPFDETPLPSRGSARAVLEINAGLSDKLGIQPGDRVCEAFVFRCKRP